MSVSNKSSWLIFSGFLITVSKISPTDCYGILPVVINICFVIEAHRRNSVWELNRRIHSYYCNVVVLFFSKKSKTNINDWSYYETNIKNHDVFYYQSTSLLLSNPLWRVMLYTRFVIKFWSRKSDAPITTVSWATPWEDNLFKNH